MKEVILLIKNGIVKIFADGPKGRGTADFTESLAKALGKIEERHKGHIGHAHHDNWKDTLKDHREEHRHG